MYDNDSSPTGLEPSSYSCNDLTRWETFDDYYTCTCTQAWTGPYCGSDVNECMLYDPCSAVETCINSAGSYECACDTILCKMNLTDWWQFALIMVACVLFSVAVIVGSILGFRSHM